MGDQVFHKWLYFNVANSTQLYILRPPSVLKSVIPANPPILFYFFSDFQVPGKALRECGSTWKCRTANPKQSLLVYVHCKLLYVFVSLVLAHLLILLTLSSWKKTAKENKNKGFCPRTGKKKKNGVLELQQLSLPWHSPPLKVCYSTFKALQQFPVLRQPWWEILIWKGESPSWGCKAFFKSWKEATSETPKLIYAQKPPFLLGGF